MTEYKSSSKVLNVSIRTRDDILYIGKADSLTSYNDKGVFDILPMHANFISLIKNKIILITDGKRTSIDVESGVLKVFRGDIEVFLEKK